MELARFMSEGALESDLKIISNIVICNIELVDGQPAVAVFNEFVRIVEGIVLAIEADARRISLL